MTMPISENTDWADSIAGNFADVLNCIERACENAGRNASEVCLLPVTKTVPAERIRIASQIGCNTFGENKVQEAKDKEETLRDLSLRWSIIGHLQTNKSKHVAQFAHEFHALDNLRVADALQRRLEIENRTLDVFVQINSSAEPSKYGIPSSDALRFIKELVPFDRLRLRGLMTLAVHSNDEMRVRSCFRKTRELRDRILELGSSGERFQDLSMGMSGDFEWAIEEGATIIRIGQALFGPRATPNNYYWPTSSSPS